MEASKSKGGLKSSLLACLSAHVRGRSAEDLATIITRIRGFNATALASDSKRGLQMKLQSPRAPVVPVLKVIPLRLIGDENTKAFLSQFEEQCKAKHLGLGSLLTD
eukprot:1161689-Pelagomonas_calceolata.AAC.6